MVPDVLWAYLITLGWALVGALSMALGLGAGLAVFTRLTPGVDEWKLVGQGNIAMALVLAAVIVASGLVVAAAIRP